MATINEILVAKNDADLTRRLQLANQLTGNMTEAEFQLALPKLLTVKIKIGADTTDLATVYTYANAVYTQAVKALPDVPGLNPAAVTDAHIQAAFEALN